MRKYPAHDAPLYNASFASSLAFRSYGEPYGDPFNEFLRLKGNFFLSYGIHICHEPTLKTKMLAKCGNVEKQAASPIAKYVPSLRKEAEEWHYVREKFDGGQRLVRTRFQVGLISDPQHIKSEEQTLHNLYRSQRWELALDKYVQLPSLRAIEVMKC